MPLQFNSVGKLLFSSLGKLWFACCCGKKQWAQNYTNAGCGPCSGGTYSGDWSATDLPYVLGGGDVQEGSAGACVIDSGAGTAVCYGAVYTPATFPEISDVGGGPTVTSDPTACNTYWVVCTNFWEGAGCTPPQSYLFGALGVRVAIGAVIPPCAPFEHLGTTYYEKNLYLAGPYCTIEEAGDRYAELYLLYQDITCELL